MKIQIILLLLLLAAGRTAVAAENVMFNGTLVALPCTLPDGDREIRVNMGTVNAQSLYLQQGMPRVPFTLHLGDCDPAIAGQVSITFAGTEDGALPGYLAIDGDRSGAAGVAIGLESSSGEQIKINQAMAAYPLQAGNNELGFQAYIAGEPEAVKNRMINTGDFISTATLELSYD